MISKSTCPILLSICLSLLIPLKAWNNVVVKGELKYKGYYTNYNGQNLYVMGTGMDQYKIGDEVKVIVDEHPYGPLKTLTVTIIPK